MRWFVLGLIAGYLIFRKEILLTVVGFDANEFVGGFEKGISGAIDAESTVVKPADKASASSATDGKVTCEC